MEKENIIWYYYIVVLFIDKIMQVMYILHYNLYNVTMCTNFVMIMYNSNYHI